MNKHVQQLMQESPKALQRRVEALKSEQTRKRESLPVKVLAWASVALSLFAVGLNVGFSSPAFILPALGVAVAACVAGLGAWGLRSNLRDSAAALNQLSQGRPLCQLFRQ
ncbi:hypothetical protein ACQQ32_005671 [Pseudomonas aeruginosa]|nr:hypothetical protein [Pseudomonas aeruginosa]